MSTPVILTPPVLPEGMCFATEQERANAYFGLASAEVGGEYTTWNIGTTTPTVDNNGFPWLKLNPDGTLDGVYTFSSGAWVRPYPFPAGPNGLRMLWVGSTTDLNTYDGGSAGAVTAMTGPFWEVDTDWADKIPRGVGTVAVGVNANELASGSSATDAVRGVYFIRRTTRTQIVG